jgi:RNA polymerase sigma-70 factor (ECF subfamily)
MRRYWPPVYASLRHRGLAREEASELTQGFFAEVVIGRRLFERASPLLGRLRALLLAALSRYRVDRIRRDKVRRTKSTVPLHQVDDEEGFLGGEVNDGTEAVFDRRWAAILLEEAGRTCRDECLRCNRDRDWHAFHVHIWLPAVNDTVPPPREQSAADLGYPSKGALAAALTRMRTDFRLHLRRAIARTVSDPEELEREYEHLARLFQPGRPGQADGGESGQK